eukprot:scaffold97177_cov66-Phaeocystis_antarctica.AAC.4
MVYPACHRVHLQAARLLLRLRSVRQLRLAAGRLVAHQALAAARPLRPAGAAHRGAPHARGARALRPRARPRRRHCQLARRTAALRAAGVRGRRGAARGRAQLPPHDQSRAANPVRPVGGHLPRAADEQDAPLVRAAAQRGRGRRRHLRPQRPPGAVAARPGASLPAADDRARVVLATRPRHVAPPLARRPRTRGPPRPVPAALRGDPRLQPRLLRLGLRVDGLPPVRQDGSRALQPLMRRRPARGEGAASTGWGSIDASTRCVCEQKKLESVL